MYDNVITLLEERHSLDKFGDTVTETIPHTVFAEIRSVGMGEFYQAAALGLKPEIKFVISDFLDYNGEKRLLFQPFMGKEQRYEVIRTFRTGTQLEIVCTREVTTNACT